MEMSLILRCYTTKVRNLILFFFKNFLMRRVMNLIQKVPPVYWEPSSNEVITENMSGRYLVCGNNHPLLIKIIITQVHPQDQLRHLVSIFMTILKRNSSNWLLVTPIFTTYVKTEDNKAVLMASNCNRAEHQDYVKRWDKETKSYKDTVIPRVVSNYISHMGGVDVLDQMMEC